MAYEFKTNFLQDNEKYLDVEDSKFLINSVYTYINNIFKTTNLKISDGRINNKQYLKNNNYIIDVAFKKDKADKNCFLVSFQFKVDVNNEVKIINCLLVKTLTNLKIDIFNNYTELLDDIMLELNDDFELISYHIYSKVIFLKDDVAFFSNYKIHKHMIESEVQYSLPDEESLVGNGFKINRINVTSDEILKDMEFLNIISKCEDKDEIVDIFEYMDFKEMAIDDNFKNAYLLFKKEDLKELQDKLSLIQIITF